MLTCVFFKIDIAYIANSILYKLYTKMAVLFLVYGIVITWWKCSVVVFFVVVCFSDLHPLQIMGIDLATWRARIGLYYYRICHPRGIKWRSSHGGLYKPGVTSWRAREITPLMLKSYLAVVALSLILQYIVHTWSKPKGSVGGKIRCHWREATSRVRETVDDGVTLVLSSSMVVVPLLLVMAGDVELNPGPGGRYLSKYRVIVQMCRLHLEEKYTRDIPTLVRFFI